MRRPTTLTIALALAAVLGLLLVRATREAGPTFHPSDVAQLGATGRPQLVEFFHPD